MKKAPARILAVDVGGTHAKVLATGQTEPRSLPSGPNFRPTDLVAAVKKLAKGWRYDVLSIGLPGPTGRSGPLTEPGNLGSGWVGYDFAAAFEKPVKVTNDAAMQALGSYDGGRMLFLGLGTGVGAALIAERTIIPMELGGLPWRRDRESLGDVLSRRGLESLGGRRWRKIVSLVASRLMKSMLVDYVVIGGGNARRLKDLPHGVRLGHNQTAFRGGFRLWEVDEVPVMATGAPVPVEVREITGWRVV